MRYGLFAVSCQISLCHIFFNVNKRGPSLGDGKDSGQEFVADNIDDCHPAFPFVQPALIIRSDLRIGMYRTNSRQMQQLFHLLVGNLAHLGSASDTGPGLIFEWSSPGVTGELAPIVEACEIAGVYNQVRSNDEPDSLDLSLIHI